jgi:hypothetical protein
MLNPDVARLLAAEHVATLREAARPRPRRTSTNAADTAGVELRLCRCEDDPQLEDLARLAGRPLPFGRFVVAVVRGRVVAAVPLVGGHPLTDPFVRTEHLLPLLELRAKQLREPEPRRSLFPRSVSLIRALIHA